MPKNKKIKISNKVEHAEKKEEEPNIVEVEA